MKKRVLSFILALFMLFLIVPMNLLTALAESVGEDDEDQVKISIESKGVHDTINKAAKPDASGYAHFTIKASEPLTENVTVYYETRDLSAIAAAGDYETTKGSVVLTPDIQEIDITVLTSRTEYSVVHAWNYSMYTSRMFEVVITDVLGDAEADEERSSALCALNAKYNYVSIGTRFGYEVFKVYDSTGTFYVRNFLVTPEWNDTKHNYTKTTSVNFPSNWVDYLDSDVDAKLYLALRNAHIDESWDNDYSSIRVSFGDVSVGMFGEFHNDELFGWGSAFVYADTGYEGEDEVHKEAYYTNFGDVYFKAHDGTYVRGIFNIMHDEYIPFEELLRKHYVIVRDNSGRWMSPTGENYPENYFISIDEGILNQKEITLTFSMAGGYDRCLTEGDLAFRLEDISAPTIEKNNGEYTIYHNFDTQKVGDKLRIAIRFNEPVQIEGKEPYIIGKINGRGIGLQTDPYYVRFDYKGGDGTDTLYFECEYNGILHITSITDLTFTNGESIMDYAGIPNPFVPEKFTISGISIDKRDPVINVDSTDFTGSLTPIRSTTVEVTLGNVTNGTVLYYSWTDSADPVTTYAHSYELTNVSVNETETVPIVASSDGEQYLHLMATSKYGKTSTRIYNSRTGMSKDCLGPFYFDNSAPTFGQAVEPIADQSDLVKKVYLIPLPTDNPNGQASGFKEMKMYYVDGEGNETVVGTFAERDFKKDIAGKKYLEFTLNASDVGIGENTREANSSVYFVLTDNLGNTATNVSRHAVVFDTNEYIDVVAPPESSLDFKDSTERVDDYTLIYKNDKTKASGGVTVYYSFELKILEEAESCTNLYNIVKIADKKDDNVTLTEGYRIRTTVDAVTGEKTLILEFTSPIESGCYDIQLLCYDASSATGDKADRVSSVYRVYIGEGTGKLGETIANGTVLINKVYQLPSSSSLHYMARPDNSPEIVDSVLTELYNEKRLSMTFSSAEEARKFVLFHEYRDLYAVTLTEALAEALNNKTSSAQPAQGEYTEAKAGQVWIRYKSVSWTVGSKQSSNWVYYYYGTSEVLNPDNFSPILNEALNYVSNVIVKTGKEVALTDLSLKEGSSTGLVDKNGAPYLNPTQIVSKDIDILESKTKTSTFEKEIKYYADGAIYSSSVVKHTGNSIREFTIVGNVQVPEGSRFQYRRYDSVGHGYISETWVDLNVTASGQRFADLILEDGWYEIRELGTSGVSLYDVYIDKKAPSLSVSWNDRDGSLLSQWLTEESERDFRSASFGITGIDSLEVDKYSYAAIYHMISKELYGVYTMTELQKASVRLPDGRYYLVVADRSGNSYWMEIYVNSTSLNCNIEESTNLRIKFTCDRDPSQIQSFSVKRNGVRLDEKYATMLTFTASGTYEFYVEDIYGNVYERVYVFTRDYPKLEWSYFSSGGYFVKYDETNEEGCFTIDPMSDGSYRIISSVPMRFQMTSDFEYCFIGPEPDKTPNDVYGHVTINSAQNFQLKVWYRSHPDVYTIYNCSADKFAPSINVSAQVYDFIPAEIELLKEAIKKATETGNAIGTQGTITSSGAVVNGSFLTPSTIAYYYGTASTKLLLNGEVVLSDFISVNVKDDNGLSFVRIYIDGELVSEQTEKTGFRDVILSRYGEYRIVSADILGNESEFVFKNESPNSFDYRVDGKLLSKDLKDHMNFDENLNYTSVNYGNASVSITALEDMSIFYMITDQDGGKIFAAFEISGGKVSALQYFLKDGASSPELITKEVLFDLGVHPHNGTEYQIFGQGGISIYAKQGDGGIELKVYSLDEGMITVESRIITTDRAFYYKKTELSRATFDLDFRVEGEIRDPDESEGQINLNKPFEIISDESAKDIAVYFSSLNDLGPDNLSERVNIYQDGVSYSHEGFYLVVARDKYGNESIYRIHLSDKFDVTTLVELSDNTSARYSPEHKEKIYSDHRIVFELHSDDVSIKVMKDGVEYIPSVSASGGITYVTLTEGGIYSLSFSDGYGNEVEASAEINSADIGFDEDILTGYNDLALKRDEGYTNLKLSVSPDKLEDIAYLAVKYGESLTVIYDDISEYGRYPDEYDLSECIGRSGDGVYTVIVRNRYGARAEKTIHYRATPTLSLERETRSSTKTESYSLEDAVEYGFWSNSSLSFKTDAKVYVFTVNGDKTECPKTILYGSSGDYGRSEYSITYVDEYGFSYSFKAYLARQDLLVSVSDGLKTEYVNNVLTTCDDVSIVFTDGAFCTYTLNNSASKIYTPGEKLSRDGVYRFTVYDLAGNVSALTVKKDTVVEYYFKTSSVTNLKNGAIVNANKVEFVVSNNDTSYIEKVLRNGSVVSDFEGNLFTEDGKWEVILADRLGNKSYFSFFIINKEQNGFAYTTPYEYHITEMWYEGNDRIRISYMNFVDHTEFTSSFSFTENGKYFATMMSDVTGAISTFEFTVNTTPPDVFLVGCEEGETTINDVTISGCKVGDRIKIYKITKTGEKLVSEVNVTSLTTEMPVIDEGGEYRVVVISEAGVETELHFSRKHVMNTAGSIFIMVIVGLAAAGLFAGLVYRNKSKTDD